MSHTDGTTDGDSQPIGRRQYLAYAGVGAVAATGILAGCSGGGDGGDGGDDTTTTTTGEQSHEESGSPPDAWTADLDADRQFWIAMGDVAHRDSFFPSTTIVREGDTVGLHLWNTGDEAHDFELPAFDVAAEDVAPGGGGNRTFTASDVGVHPIECELHPSWMWGQLVVLPESGGNIPAVDQRPLRIAMGDVAERDSFMPSTNVVVEGEEVPVSLINNGDEAHDFEIPAFDVAAEDVAPEAEVSKTFTADQPGIHPIECELHPTWMWGQLVVLPSDGDYARMAGGEERTLRMTMGDIAGRESFFPSTNVVKQGQAVAVRLKNAGAEIHDMDIEAFDVEVEVEAGNTKEFSFTADRGGLHRIVCELHPPEMNGQLWVVPSA